MSNPSSALSPVNLAIGAGVALFEVTTLGQPLEVLKTHMASHRDENLRTAFRKTLDRGGWKGFYAGLVPWGWIEAATTGGILLFTASAVESFAKAHDVKPGAAGLLGGIAGGAAQAYLAMGICTCMKTAEITRDKSIHSSTIPGEPSVPKNSQVPSTMSLFMQTIRKEGLSGIYKGVNAVALRQMTGWGSRIGISRAAESSIRKWKKLAPKEQLSPVDKVLASALGGALGTWNHPIEVIRVEMQSLVKKKDSDKPAPPTSASSAAAAASSTNTSKPKTKPTMLSTAEKIYHEAGVKGFFRGVTPRVGLSAYRTICLVTLGDYVKEWVHKSNARKARFAARMAERSSKSS